MDFDKLEKMLGSSSNLAQKKQNMKTTLREKLEEIDKECAECPPELAEAALRLIRLKLRDARQADAVVVAAATKRRIKELEEELEAAYLQQEADSKALRQSRQ
jgi:16S rRNA G1207 methylase RsmC